MHFIAVTASTMYKDYMRNKDYMMRAKSRALRHYYVHYNTSTQRVLCIE